MAEAPVNKPIQVAHSILRAVEYDFAVRAIKIIARAKIPWLNNALAGKIFDIILTGFANAIYKDISQFISIKIIDIQVASQKASYDKSREAFRLALESGDKDAIAKAKAEFEAAFSRGVHFDGV